MDDLVEEALTRGGPVGRGQGQAQGERARALRRPAAAALHRPLHRGRAGRDPDGRALRVARPDRHLQDRRPDARAGEATTRSSSSRTTCSRPRGSRTARRSSPPRSTRTAMRHGRLVEMDWTNKIFTNPADTAHRGLHLRPLRLARSAAGPGASPGASAAHPMVATSVGITITVVRSGSRTPTSPSRTPRV